MFLLKPTYILVDVVSSFQQGAYDIMLDTKMHPSQHFEAKKQARFTGTSSRIWKFPVPDAKTLRPGLQLFPLNTFFFPEFSHKAGVLHRGSHWLELQERELFLSSADPGLSAGPPKKGRGLKDAQNSSPNMHFIWLRYRQYRTIM